jgi:hypothetical protein
MYASYIYISLILVIGIFTSFFNIGVKSLWGDDIVSWFIVIQTNLADFYRYSISNHLPLFDMLLFTWVRIFGESEIGLRSLAAVFLIISLPILYYVANVFLNKINSFLIVIGYLCYMTFNNFTQSVVRYSLYYLLAFLVFFFALKIINYPEKKKSYLFFFFSLTLILMTHMYSLFLFSSLFLSFTFIFLKEKKFRYINVIFLLMLCSLILVSPFLFDYLSLFPQRTASLIEIVSPFTFILFWYKLNYNSIILSIIGAILFFPMLYCIFLNRFNKNIAFTILVLIFLIPQPLILGLFIKIFEFHYYGYIVAFYTIFLFWLLQIVFKKLIIKDKIFNFGLSKAIFKFKSKNVSIKSFILIIIILFQTYYIFYNVRATVEYYNGPSIEDWKGISSYLLEDISTPDVILFSPWYFHLSLTYYFKLNNTFDELNLNDPLIQVKFIFSLLNNGSIWIITWFKPFLSNDLSLVLKDYIVFLKNDFNEPIQYADNYSGSRLILIKLNNI